jgi:hypothetical protein
MRAASSENADDRGIRGATHSSLCVVANAHGRCRHVANRGGTSDLQSRVPISTSIGRFSSMRPNGEAWAYRVHQLPLTRTVGAW